MNARLLSVLSLSLSLSLLLPRPAAGAEPKAAPKKAATPTPAAAAPTPAAAAAEGPIFDPEAVGQLQITDYQKVSLDSGRRLVIIFGTNDCVPCRTFNHALHKDKFFDSFLSQFVPVYIDVSSGTNASLLLPYNIDTRAELPAIVILMPDARIMEVLAHGEMAAVARKGDAAVQNYFLERFAKGDK